MGSDRRPAPAVRVLAGVCLLGVVTAAAWYWGLRTPTPPTAATPVTPAGDDDLEPPVPVNPGYVGVQACAPCHAKRVEEYKETRHAVAMVPASPGRMPAAFTDGHGTYKTTVPGLRFEMGRTEHGYAATAVRADPGGEKRMTSPIAFVYGSGGVFDEVYFTWRGDRLYELPVVYLHPPHGWGNVPFAAQGEGDGSRETAFRCLECHNTWFAHLPDGVKNRYRPDSFIPGVGCERCHGPGADHVAHHAAHPGGPAKAIVHPGYLSRDRLTDVCAQCHSNANKPLGPALTYRPGEPLEKYYRTAVPAHRENDHVANQTRYMRESKCFQKSDTLTCVTCHNPHKPTDHDATRRSCRQCHQPEHCKEQPKLPAGVRADCVGCHMPPRVWMTVHFHTADDLFVPPIRRFEHRIGVYPESTNTVLLEWHRKQADPASQAEADRLAKAVSGYWLAEADRRAGEARYLAAVGAVREALRVEPTPAAREKLDRYKRTQAALLDDLAEGERLIVARRMPDAIRLYERVLAVHPRNAAAQGKLGMLLADSNQTEKAVEHLRKVAECGPEDPYGEGLLGYMALRDGRFEEAVKHYQRVEEIEPFNARARFYWGLALLRQGYAAAAADRFRAALAVNPVFAEAHQGLSQALRLLGKTAEADEHERRAARLVNR